MSQAVQLRDMESLLDQIEDNQKLQNLLESLPDRTRRSVMVPFGSVAFFPGQLVHTNECFVDMGEVTWYILNLMCREPLIGVLLEPFTESYAGLGRCWRDCRKVHQGNRIYPTAAAASTWYAIVF